MFDEPPPAQRAVGEAMPSPDRPAEEDRTPASHGVGSNDIGTGIAQMPEPATHMGPNSTRRGRTTVSEELEGFLSDSSFNNLNRVQKHRVHRREEAQRRPRSPSTSSRGEGPSNKTKGKGPDPGDWGIDMSESEIELQKATMESLAKQKDNRVIFEDGIDTSGNETGEISANESDSVVNRKRRHNKDRSKKWKKTHRKEKGKKSNRAPSEEIRGMIDTALHGNKSTKNLKSKEKDIRHTHVGLKPSEQIGKENYINTAFSKMKRLSNGKPKRGKKAKRQKEGQ
ncbi:hypothetical protein FA13DRAFT_1714196 [Coprinellus micaceus]|uniref:Uncharacterized protein n=1 Tax=Coprinellus micaceus TaxID=71717 RepID=A0A4Y7SUZ4_COPMI|nr:hypothetical protein FA13DRAFT_1714196 [Coprinellus micaceus]